MHLCISIVSARYCTLLMSKSISWFSLPLLASLSVALLSQRPVQAQAYNPASLPSSGEVSDTLSNKDIPTGTGGFTRDYRVAFRAGDQVVIDLTSQQFDTIVTLIGPDGKTVGENDDAPDGTTNSMLFARIATAGNYIIRIAPYAGQGGGSFKLKVTRLQPVQ